MYVIRSVKVVIGLASILQFSSLAEAQNSSKKPRPAPQAAASPPPAAPAAPTTPVETSSASSAHNFNYQSDGLLDFKEGRYAFAFAFPEGGSFMGPGYIGAKKFLSDHEAFGGYLLIGNDSAAKANSFGLAGKYQSYFAQRNAVLLYWFAQLSLGQNGGTANEGRDDLLFGLAGGAGLEYSLMRDFSLSIEGGLSYNTLPDSENAYTTGTSKFAVNFYY